jgi:hypothetical protein
VDVRGLRLTEEGCVYEKVKNDKNDNLQLIKRITSLEETCPASPDSY